MNDTSINWTDFSSNLIRARHLDNGKVGHFCTHKNAKCKNCYAEAINLRFGTRLAYLPAHRDKIEFFFVEAEAERLRRLNARLKVKGETRKVFISSMTDLFHETMPHSLINEVYAVMATCQNLTFQVLTKRAEVALRYFEYLRKDFEDAGSQFQPLPNVWFGLTPEDDGSDIPLLFKIPATVRWLSLEPLLREIDLTTIPYGNGLYVNCLTAQNSPDIGLVQPTLNWIVVGGESGPKARPSNLQWIRFLSHQCADNHVPLWVKQAGTKAYQQERIHLPALPWKTNGKGEALTDLPEDLRIRQFPGKG